MNLLNLILSAVISVIVSYFSINNILNEKCKLKTFMVYTLVLSPLIFITCTFFEGITKLTLNIVFTIIALYLSVFKKFSLLCTCIRNVSFCFRVHYFYNCISFI